MVKIKLFEDFDFDFDEIDIPEEDYLYVKKSNIEGAGNGLFTAIDIEKNEVIAVYKGEVLTKREADNRKLANEDAYFMNLPNGRYLDCGRTQGYAKYANDILGTNFKQNSVIAMDGRKVVLVATKHIKPGQEILTSYGKNYWKDKINI